MSKLLNILILFAVAFFLCPDAETNAENQRRMAITIDDLPTLGHGSLSVEEQKAYFLRILDILDKNKVQTTGFVTGNNLNPATRPLLDSFVARGHLLGNHTFAHSDLNEVSVSEFTADILHLEKEIAPLSNGKKYFRFPMLQRGDTPAKKDSIAAFLKNSGYTIVPVTIDNDDWRFNRDYVRTLKDGDTARAEEIAAEYIIHMVERAEYFESLGIKITGRSVPHILLVHMNYLNSNCLDELLAYFAGTGWKFISVDEALADPVFRLPDNYTGVRGISWLERINN